MHEPGRLNKECLRQVFQNAFEARNITSIDNQSSDKLGQCLFERFIYNKPAIMAL